LESIQDDFVSAHPRRYSNILPQLLAASQVPGHLPNY
jgi:hypothetical protein